MDLAFDVLHWERVGFDIEPLYPAKGPETLSGPTWIYWKSVGTDVEPLYPPQQVSPPSPGPVVSPFGGGGMADPNQDHPITRHAVAFAEMLLRTRGHARLIHRFTSRARGSLPIAVSAASLGAMDDGARRAALLGLLQQSLGGEAAGRSDPFSAKEMALLMALFNDREQGKHGVSNGKA